MRSKCTFSAICAAFALGSLASADDSNCQLVNFTYTGTTSFQSPVHSTSKVGPTSIGDDMDMIGLELYSEEGVPDYNFNELDTFTITNVTLDFKYIGSGTPPATSFVTLNPDPEEYGTSTDQWTEHPPIPSGDETFINKVTGVLATFSKTYSPGTPPYQGGETFTGTSSSWTPTFTSGGPTLESDGYYHYFMVVVPWPGGTQKVVISNQLIYGERMNVGGMAMAATTEWVLTDIDGKWSSG